MSEVKKFCRYCGSELSAGANFCPSCGKSHRAPTPPLQKSRTTVSVGVYILTIIIVLIAGGWIGAASKGPTVTPYRYSYPDNSRPNSYSYSNSSPAT